MYLHQNANKEVDIFFMNRLYYGSIIHTPVYISRLTWIKQHYKYNFYINDISGFCNLYWSKEVEKHLTEINYLGI